MPKKQENTFAWNETIQKLVEIDKDTVDREIEKFTSNRDNNIVPDEDLKNIDPHVIPYLMMAREEKYLKEQQEYIAMEMYKQFAKDDFKSFCKVQKQILKKQEVDYFKNNMK